MISSHENPTPRPWFARLAGVLDHRFFPKPDPSGRAPTPAAAPSCTPASGPR